MKKIWLLILLGTAFVLFLIGISIPGLLSPLHIIVVVVSVLLGLIFYLRVFWDVITTRELDKGERTLWITAIVCLPVIGDILYLLIHGASASRQVPKADI